MLIRMACGVLCVAPLVALELGTRSEPPPLAALFAAVAVAGLWGLLLAGIDGSLAALSRRTGMSKRWERALHERFQGATRGTHSHARAISQLTVLVLLAATWPVLNARLASLQDTQVAQSLGVFLLLMGAVLLSFLAHALEFGLGAWLSRFERSKLNPRLAMFCYAGVLLGTLAVVSARLLFAHGDALGLAAAAPYAVLVFALYLAVLTLFRALNHKAAQRLAGVTIVLWLGMFASALAGVGLTPAAVSAIDRSLSASVLAAPLRKLSDFDRDGEGFVLGARDCAPFDKRRHSAARELPNNQIDEDCDGADTTDKQLATTTEVALAPLTPGQVKRYNIIWIVIDSLRADHVSALGYHRNTTPNLDRLAEQAWLFEQAHSQGASTQISFPSFFTGENPTSLEWIRNGRLQMAPQHVTIAEKLRSLGYRTGFLYNGWIEEHMSGVMQGFDHRESAWPDRKEWRKWHTMSAPSTLGGAMHFIEESEQKHASKPFFLTLYFEDPHAPYERHPQKDMPNFGRSELDRFDQEIVFADRHVGVLLDYLRFRPKVWDDTIIVITADHGEEFGEHGGRHHGHNCHVESTHVPLFVRIPGEPARRSAVPVGLVDIVPTLLERVGAIDQPTFADGRSLRWGLSASPKEQRTRPLFCTLQDLQTETTSMHSVRRNGLLLVKHMSSGQIQLFDTRTDPKEQTDVAANPDYAAERTELTALLENAIMGKSLP